MSEHVTLTLRAPVTSRLGAECVVPESFATLANADIARLTVWEGTTARQLGDVFTVSGERSANVRIVGDASAIDGLGTAMRDGLLEITGSAGNEVGNGMAGGAIRVTGSVGHDCGVHMSGGSIVVDRDAGDRVGSARGGRSKGMIGGEIVVRGRVGDRAGAHMRRGLIVCARAGNQAAESMIAGTIMVLEGLGAECGRWNKRGTVISLVSGVTPLPGYLYACTYRPPIIPVLLGWLRSRYALQIAADRNTGLYARWVGDIGELGKGEMLIWTQP